nr:M1 family aminopeptidase [Caenimonas aquaedulcis]
MEATRQLLPYYSNYFGQPYPLPKLDQLAVPGVRFGGMEDWGLISYIENLLLLAPARDTAERRYLNYLFMAHEIAHQWFGNLVSPASWDDIWLNEAFAEWIQSKALDHFHPEWGTPLRRRIALEPTLASDATAATRPIRGALVMEDRVADLFDGITYDKGAAVVGMLEQWIGEEPFRRGLASYMKDRAFKPATAGDLWHHLALASGKPVARVAQFWTERRGYPAIGVSQVCEAGSTRVHLTRKRFALVDGLTDEPWPVPVVVAHGDRVQPVLMEGPEHTMTWPGCDERPVVVNAGGAGYYRVFPDAPLAHRLLEAYPSLAPVDQLAILADSFAAVQGGTRPLREHFGLLRAVKRSQAEGRDTLFTVAVAQWEWMAVALRGTQAEPAMKAAERRFLGPELTRLGWAPRAGESAAAALLRANVVKRLAVLEDPAALAGVRSRCAAARANDATQVAPSIRIAVLVGCASTLDDAAFSQLFEAFRSAPSQGERMALLRGLAGEADEARARRLLVAAAAGQFPGTMAAALPAMMAESTRLGPVAYQLTVEFWEPLARAAGESLAGKQSLLPRAAIALSSSADAEQVIADQIRLMGEAGRLPAEREAAAVLVRARLKAREEVGLAAALQGWPDE